MFKKVSVSELISLAVLFIFTLLIFRKIFLAGLYPFPGNLMVTFFFPWQLGGWPEYDMWVTAKEFIGSDAIRQHIPWRELAVEQFKKGQLPLWNPFAFSGMPLLANVQSAVFYPYNLVFLVLPFFQAWMLYIVIQPLLISWFTFLFARSLKVSQPAALLAGLSFASSSYVLIWMEIGVMGHTIMWLPLMLYAIEHLLNFPQKGRLGNHQIWYLLLLVLATAVMGLAGHIQSMVNVLLLSLAYFGTKTYLLDPKKRVQAGVLASLWLILAVGIMAIQYVPAIELYLQSPIRDNLGKEVFLELKTPWKNFLTFFAPDFFGHPATGNYWSDIYGDGTPFFGVATLFFAVFAMIKVRKWPILFFSGASLIYLSYTFAGPGYWMASIFSIPIFSSTLASRSFFIPIFCLCLLASFGYDAVAQQKRLGKRLALTMMVFLVIYLALASLAFLANYLPLADLWKENLPITKKNIVLPFVSFMFLVVTIVSHMFFRNKIFFAILVLTPSMLLALYQSNKTLPMSRQEFFFPSHPLVAQAQKQNDLMRTEGLINAYFDKNFSTYYRLYSAQGYDSLRVKSYAQLFAAHENEGTLPQSYSKSDADFSKEGVPERSRLLDLTSVGYLYDKSEAHPHEWINEPQNFPNDSVDLSYVGGVFKLYRRVHTLPRASLKFKIEVLPDDKERLARLFDPKFDPFTTIILESSSQISANNEATGSAQIVDYSPNKVEIEVNSTHPSMLLLTDVYYPGWKVQVNNQDSEIFRANHTFKSVMVPAGESQVIFSYEPTTFKVGALISLLSLSSVGIIFLILKNRYVA